MPSVSQCLFCFEGSETWVFGTWYTKLMILHTSTSKHLFWDTEDWMNWSIRSRPKPMEIIWLSSACDVLIHAGSYFAFFSLCSSDDCVADRGWTNSLLPAIINWTSNELLIWLSPLCRPSASHANFIIDLNLLSERIYFYLVTLFRWKMRKKRIENRIWKVKAAGGWKCAWSEIKEALSTLGSSQIKIKCDEKRKNIIAEA